MKNLSIEPQNIVVIGDMYVSPDTMEEAVKKSCICCGKITKLFWGDHDSEKFAKIQQVLENGGVESVFIADGLEEVIENTNIIMTHFSPIPRRIIKKGKNLKLIMTSRGGVEHINLDKASEMNIPVINVIRNAEPVADFALGLMFDITRNITLSNKFVREGKWIHNFYNSSEIKLLNRHLVGLVGLGNIGAAVARRLHGLGVKVIAFDSYVSKDAMNKMGLDFVEKVDTLEDIFKKSDIISLHLRLTKETEGIIDKHLFHMMKKNAYLINTARGGLIKEEDLIDALQNKVFLGAAMDVSVMEPISQENPLLKMNNVVVTSHIASMMEDAITNSPYLLIEEVDRFLEKDITSRVVNINEIKI